MNSNQIKGAIKDVTGTLRRKVGAITGSTRQQIKGAAEQVQGKTQKAAGDVEDAVRKSGGSH